jgi:signal transduction histidine kinase
MAIRLPRFSLQTWILVLTILISGTVLTVADVVSMSSAIRSVEKQLGEQTADTARSLAEELENTSADNFNETFQILTRQVMEREPTVVRMDVYADYGHDLRLLASSSSSGDRPLEGKEVQAFYHGQADTFIIAGSPNRRIFSIHLLRLPGNLPGFLTVVCSLRTVDEIWNTHSRIRLYSILVSTLLLVAGITLLFRLFVYRHIHHLVHIMHRFQGGETTARARENLGGEFGELVANFNRMLAQIHRLNTQMQEQIDQAVAELAARNKTLADLNQQLFDLQKQLTQSERLALVGQLTAAFAHEIGSPLSAVSTHLQLLLENSHLETKTRERIQLALEQVDRVCGIVEDLLAKTRQRKSPERLDMAAVIHRVTDLLGPTLEARRVQLEFVADELDYPVEGNAGELQQVFLNLFHNALDAMTVPGRLEVTLHRAGARSENRTGWIEATVADDGSGIPADRLDRIFEPFFTSKDSGKGTGLGLSMCQEIVRRHGGTISVASTPGRGSVFTIRLPEASLDVRSQPDLEEEKRL